MCDTMDQTELDIPTTAVERPRVATVTYTTQPAPTTNAVATPYPEKAGRSLSTIHHGCKRDLFFRDRDETETFEKLSETKARPFQFTPGPSILASRPRRFLKCQKRHTLSSLWLQTAVNYAGFRSVNIQKTGHVCNSFSETFTPFSQRLLAISKTPVLCTCMH